MFYFRFSHINLLQESRLTMISTFIDSIAITSNKKQTFSCQDLLEQIKICASYQNNSKNYNCSYLIEALENCN